MNKILIIVSLGLSVFFFTQCKKDTHIPLNITLYDKPLDTIQLYTRGRWKLFYLTGGWYSNHIQYVDSVYWTIDSNHIIIQEDGIKTTDTTINWTFTHAVRGGVDSTWTLNFAEKVAPFWNVFVIDEIKNDELIIHESAYDASDLHFIKLN